MTIQEAYRQLLAQLYELYDSREAANIGDWVIEHVTGQPRIERIINKQLRLTKEQEQKLQQATAGLMQSKPIQYVLRECWFAGLRLYVDENVLIPRPETEELVEWIVADLQENNLRFNVNAQCSMHNVQCSILDVGTGSGCIALALAKAIIGARVTGIDVSEGALMVAEKNARDHNANIRLQQSDFLNKEEWQKMETFDIIVSNPPYIRLSEGCTMNDNVTKHEPHTALFVPDDDALIFYKGLAEFGCSNLNINGSIYMEINEVLGEAVITLFEQAGYKNVVLRKDMQGKDRMVKATKE